MTREERFLTIPMSFFSETGEANSIKIINIPKFNNFSVTDIPIKLQKLLYLSFGKILDDASVLYNFKFYIYEDEKTIVIPEKMTGINMYSYLIRLIKRYPYIKVTLYSRKISEWIILNHIV